MPCRLAVARREKKTSIRHCGLSSFVKAMEPSKFRKNRKVCFKSVCLFFAYLASFHSFGASSAAFFMAFQWFLFSLYLTSFFSVALALFDLVFASSLMSFFFANNFWKFFLAYLALLHVFLHLPSKPKYASPDAMVLEVNSAIAIKIALLGSFV